MRPQIPPNLGYAVDSDHYSKNVDLTNPQHMTEEILNGYVTIMRVNYQRDDRTDVRLWDAFKECRFIDQLVDSVA